MNAYHFIRKLVILGIIFLVTIGLIFPSTSAEPDVDGGDGVWLDTFTNAENVTLRNCDWDDDSDSIILNRTKSNVKFDFRDKRSHKAYSYTTRTFSNLCPPNFHILLEHELKVYTDEINKIKKEDRNAYITSSETKKFNIHHFRFDIDIKPENINELEITWVGKGQYISKIRLFLWKYDKTFPNLGVWDVLDATKKDDDWETLDGTITGDDIIQALKNNNILDICVVGIRADRDDTIKLFSDYVKVQYETQVGYTLNDGFAETNITINPKKLSNVKNFYWDILTWSDYEIGNTTVKYQIIYQNKTGDFTPVEDKYLPGNKKGFTKPPVHLNTIPANIDKYSKLKIRANLSTDNYKITPKIYSWAITWQTKPGRWQDLFNFSYRLEKNNININNGSINIAPFTGDWPMFGQNPQNTRTSMGEGPVKYQDNWWCQLGDENASISNSVIIDGAIYITSHNKMRFYIIDNISSVPVGGFHELKPKYVYNNTYLEENLNKSLVNSLTLTEEFIIIATGKTKRQGTNNYVIALNRNDNSEEWRFSYPNNTEDDQEPICYFSNPVLYQDKVFITSWSGDPAIIQSNNNNKVIALDLSSGDPVWDEPFDLPAGSFSTPAVYNNTIIVGCNNKFGNSLFALNTENGSVIWKKSVGAIGRSSPVIYKDKVFIVSEVKKFIGSNVKITSLHMKNGSILGEKTIGRSFFSLLGFLDRTRTLADSTPSIYKDTIYVASPNGYIHALDANDIKKQVWKTSVENWHIGDHLKSKYLSTSPAYADGIVYIGTPSGYFYALDASNGQKKSGWDDFRTFKRIYVDGNWEITDDHPSIVSSPIISNGLVFFGDDNGKLYSLGKFEKPENKEISGSIVSIPIKIPDQYWWNEFHTNYDKLVSKKNSIKFSILDKDRNFIKEITKKSAIVDNEFDERIIRLCADLYAKNVSFNPKLLDWKVTFIKDNKPPIIDIETFKPIGGWINRTTPVCKVTVRDEGSGLLLSSAEYTLYYYVNDSTLKEYSDKPQYTGENGDESSILIVNISNLNFSKNITKLENITFSIKDYANNFDTEVFSFKQDFDKPSSEIVGDIKETYKYSPIVISANAFDPGRLNKDASGIKLVELKYRFSQNGEFSGEWQHFGDSGPKIPTTVYNARWAFTDEKRGGWYQLCSIAIDDRGNKEDLPKENDTRIVTFIFDPNPPNDPQFTVPSWFNTTPELSAVFSDDFILESVEYRPYFDTEWIQLKSGINAQSYKATWTLLPRFWDRMEEGETNYLYFRLIDSLGNKKEIANINNAFKITKDISEPIVDLDIPDLEAEWSWDDTFNISAFADDINGSGIEFVELYYRFSEDNETWNNWTRYEDPLTSTPFEWKFRADEGNGYYEFYIRAEDEAGNIATSPIFTTGVNIFPLMFVISMVILVIALLLFTTILYILWRKKKQ